MILIVGGRGAGKRAFAVNFLDAKWEDMSEGTDEKPILYDLQDLDPLPSVAVLQRKTIVICNEVGCGVVPMDQTERRRREEVGRLCIALAQGADAVYRVQCGLGMRLK